MEIDLLRGFPRMPWNDLPACDYCIVVSRSEDRPRAGVWPVLLPNRLPEIHIPLRAGDQDAKLDLQKCLDHIYDVAGYEYYIYDGPPEPPLSGEMENWATPFVSRLM